MVVFVIYQYNVGKYRCVCVCVCRFFDDHIKRKKEKI